MRHVFSAFSRGFLFAFISAASLSSLPIGVGVAAAEEEVSSSPREASQDELPPLPPCQCGHSTKALILSTSNGLTDQQHITHALQGSADGKSCYEMSCTGSLTYINLLIMANQGDATALQMKAVFNNKEILATYISGEASNNCTVISGRTPFVFANCAPLNGMTSEQTTAVYTALANGKPLPNVAKASCSVWENADGSIFYAGDAVAIPQSAPICEGFYQNLKKRSLAAAASQTSK